MECAQSEDVVHKWLVRFEVISSAPVYGPQFAKPGQTFDGFSVESLQNFTSGEILDAHAEYLGDARRGIYQLSRVARAKDS